MNEIRQAMEEMTEENWHKGHFYNAEGDKACVLGHLRWQFEYFRALDGNWTRLYPMDHSLDRYNKMVDLLHATAREHTNNKCSAISIFNDLPKTTLPEVKAIMEKAAIKWEEQYG